ncbi:MAG: hypothetical protein Q8R76_09655 [Candidatus Omnitrophota bacterium]|nr:hypothetical protein [Candidatus Omnitrophota bacterium]
MKKIFAITLVVFVACLAVQVPAMAASPWTEEADYYAKSVSKLQFGLKNVVFGWSEIFTQTTAAAAEDRPQIEGFGEGLWNAIVYTALGAVHVVTFPIPLDVPIPNNGVDL